MIARLAVLTLGNPWVAGSLAAIVLAGLSAAYVKGRWDGAALAAADQSAKQEKSINVTVNKAERARAVRRDCTRRGLQFDPERIACAK